MEQSSESTISAPSVAAPVAAHLDSHVAPYAPRIYFIHPLWVGPLSEWDSVLEHVAAMGFDHILIAPPFLPGRTGNLLATADHDKLHPALDDGTHTATQWLAVLARAARTHGLDLLLDVITDRMSADGERCAAQPGWFHPHDSAPGLDPRLPPALDNLVWANFTAPDTAMQLGEWWARRLREWSDAGVAGFRFDAPHHVPPHIWRKLATAVREARPDSHFLAWTPGVARADQALLVDAGFDASFSSLRWWDYRAPWFVDEHALLARIGAPVAVCEAPFGNRLAHDFDPLATSTLLLNAYRRSLVSAAGTGCGLLVPMGFEYGAREALSIAHGEAGQLAASRAAAPFDLTADLMRVNALIAATPTLRSVGALRSLSGPGAPVAALLRVNGADARAATDALLIVVNTTLERPAPFSVGQVLDGIPGGFTRFTELQTTVPASALHARAVPTLADNGARDAAIDPAIDALGTVASGSVGLFTALREAPVCLVPGPGKRASKAAEKKLVTDALSSPRIAIEAVTPAVDEGRFVVKRVVGERVQVEADIFADGHDQLAAALWWRAGDADAWQEAPMQPLVNDRWRGEFPLSRLGRHEFTVVAWRDEYGSLAHHMHRKLDAGQTVDLEVQEMRTLLGAIVEEATTGHRNAAPLAAISKQLVRANATRKLELSLAPQTAKAVADAQYRPFLVQHPVTVRIDAERAAARFASWYELFPRSMSGDEHRHGNFIDVIGKLPRIRDMGFDVLYFPPIHPIGKQNRKGRNNTLDAASDDVGSPYAIGSADGGHDALHPELGSFDDFKSLLEAAREQGLEIALDFAIQCSPDHPWLAQHPTWFAWRPDGTLRYAENPPKKYQDIVNPDFYAADAKPDLWLALRDVVLFWCAAGIRIFRVDNPHTKPLPFWEWMIGDIRGRHPDTIFLAEAFTRPKVMNRLAKVGFSQSYTYFTWRESKAEFIEYLTQLTTGPEKNFFRPNFFVNTPDINPRYLQYANRAGFVIRAALAATLSGLWGVYSGFELCEATPLPGKDGTQSEEYLDSEKYQIREWDWNRPGNIVGEITLLNRIRRANPALQSHLTVSFLGAQNDRVLFFEKATASRDNVVLIAICLDPYTPQTTTLELPLWRWKLDDNASLAAIDQVTGEQFTWHGKSQQLHLDPGALPFAIWSVTPTHGGTQ